MIDSIDLSGTKLKAKEQAAVVKFCEALVNKPEIKTRSILLYGSAARDDYRSKRSDINILVVVERMDVAILKKIRYPATRGRLSRIAPFFITEENLRSSADVFPVKFLSMQESYHVLWGHDVLGDLEIGREYLRLRCEQEIKNLLMRLRRHFIMGGGRKLREMMSNRIVGFLENLRVVLSLTQKSLPPREEVVNAAAEKFELDAEILQNVIALRKKDISISKKKTEQLNDKFMGIVDKVAQITDQMK